MSNEHKIIYEILLKEQNFQDNIKKVKQALSGLSSAVSVSNKALSELGKGIEIKIKGIDKLDAVNIKIQALLKTMTSLKEIMKSLNLDLSGLSSLDSIIRRIEKLERKLKDLKDSGDNGLGGFNEGLAKTILGVDLLEKAFFKAFEIIRKSINAAFEEYVKFQAEVYNTRATTGGSIEEFSKQAGLTLKAAKDLNVSATEAQKSLKTLASAGKEGGEALSLFSDAQIFVQATGADLNDTTNGLITVMANYKVTAKDIPTVLNQIAVAASQSKLEVKDYTAQIGMLATAAAPAGIKLDELLSIFSLFGNKLRNAPEAATALGNMISKISQPTVSMKKSVTELQEAAKQANVTFTGFGPSAIRAAGGLETYIKTLMKIAEVYKMPDDLIAELFKEKRAFKGLQSAFQQINDVTKLKDKVINDVNYMQRAFNESTQKISYRFDAIKNDLLNSAMELFVKIEPHIQHFITFIEDSINQAAGYVGQFKDFIDGIMKDNFTATDTKDLENTIQVLSDIFKAVTHTVGNIIEVIFAGTTTLKNLISLISAQIIAGFMPILDIKNLWSIAKTSGLRGIQEYFNSQQDLLKEKTDSYLKSWRNFHDKTKDLVNEVGSFEVPVPKIVVNSKPGRNPKPAEKTRFDPKSTFEKSGTRENKSFTSENKEQSILEYYQRLNQDTLNQLKVIATDNSQAQALAEIDKKYDDLNFKAHQTLAKVKDTATIAAINAFLGTSNKARGSEKTKIKEEFKKKADDVLESIKVANDDIKNRLKDISEGNNFKDIGALRDFQTRFNKDDKYKADLTKYGYIDPDGAIKELQKNFKEISSKSIEAFEKERKASANKSISKGNKAIDKESIESDNLKIKSMELKNTFDSIENIKNLSDFKSGIIKKELKDKLDIISEEEEQSTLALNKELQGLKDNNASEIEIEKFKAERLIQIGKETNQKILNETEKTNLALKETNDKKWQDILKTSAKFMTGFGGIGEGLSKSNNGTVKGVGDTISSAADIGGKVISVLASGDVTQAAISGVQELTNSFISQINTLDDLSRAIKRGGVSQQELNEFMSDSLKSIPFLGEAFSKLARVITDKFGLTISKENQTLFKEFTDNLINAANKILEVSSKFTDLQYELDKSRLESMSDSTEKKIKLLDFEANHQKDLAKREYTDRNLLKLALEKIDQDLANQKFELEKSTSEQIQKINESNYNAVIDVKTKEAKARIDILKSSIKTELELEIDKKQKLADIDSGRLQTAQEKAKRLTAFNQAVASSSKKAGFFRANEKSFSDGYTGFTGNETSRKTVTDDFELGKIDFDSYSKQRSQLGLDKYLYYQKKASEEKDAGKHQILIDKAIEGEKEYYDFVFDKEKERINAESQAEKIKSDKALQDLAIEQAKLKDITDQVDKDFKDASGNFNKYLVDDFRKFIDYLKPTLGTALYDTLQSANKTFLDNIIESKKVLGTSYNTPMPTTASISSPQGTMISSASNTSLNSSEFFNAQPQAPQSIGGFIGSSLNGAALSRDGLYAALAKAMGNDTVAHIIAQYGSSSTQELQDKLRVRQLENAGKGLAGGGITSGSKDGYLMALHGVEGVVNEQGANNIMSVMNIAANPAYFLRKAQEMAALRNSNINNNSSYSSVDAKVINVYITGTNLKTSDIKEAVMAGIHSDTKNKKTGYRA